MEQQALENRIKTLETMLAQANQDSDQMNKELSIAKLDLKNINKPKITKEFVEEIREAVHQALNQINFNNVDCYDVDFELDYNNTLSVSNIEFNEVDEINEAVCDYIEYLFNIVEEDEN